MYIFDLKIVVLLFVGLSAVIVFISVLITGLYYRRSRKLAQASKIISEFARINLFLGAFSHEVRTPLTTMMVHLELAQLDGVTPEIQATSLALVHKEVIRLNRIIQDLALYNRYQLVTNNDHCAIDLLLIVEAAIGQVILRAEAKNMVMEFDHDHDIPKVMGNADRLEQLFINLLDNAVKYCRPSDFILVRINQRGKAIHCIVQDTGPGIAKEHLSHITEPFYRICKEIDSSGLGLAIANEIARNHQTELNITSSANNIDSGTTICFTLPMAK